MLPEVKFTYSKKTYMVPSETDDNAGKGKYGTCCTEIDLWEANKISMADSSSSEADN